MIEYDRLISFLEAANSPAKVIEQYKLAHTASGELHQEHKIYQSGWHNMEGVMLSIPDKTTNADYQVYPIATNERSLKELLLAFPRQSVGIFLITDEWIENRIRDFFAKEKTILHHTSVKSHQ